MDRKIHSLLVLILAVITACTGFTAGPAEAQDASWAPPEPSDNEKDWVRISSGEWITGNLDLLRDETLYFDTPELALYSQHHNDMRKRHKVRCRQYVDSDLFFLEIKFKTDRQRTIKSRLQMPEMVERLEGESLAFVAEHCPHVVDQLVAVIYNSFSRITLVSKYRRERLTLDIDYRHHWKDEAGSLPGIAIAEVKQRKFSFESDFLQQLRSFNIRSTGFSKYCTGIADVYPQVKYNRFKRRFLMLERLSRLKDRP